MRVRSLASERLAYERLGGVVAQPHGLLLPGKRADANVGAGRGAGHRRQAGVDATDRCGLRLLPAQSRAATTLDDGLTLGHRGVGRADEQHERSDDADGHHERSERTVHPGDSLPPSHGVELVCRVAGAVVLADVHDAERDERGQGQRDRVKEPQREPRGVGVAVPVRKPDRAVAHRQRLLERSESPEAELPHEPEGQCDCSDENPEDHAKRQHERNREPEGREYAPSELALVARRLLVEDADDALQPCGRLLGEHVRGDVDRLVGEGVLDVRDIHPPEPERTVLFEQIAITDDGPRGTLVAQVDDGRPQFVGARPAEGNVRHLQVEPDELRVRLVPLLFRVVAREG